MTFKYKITSLILTILLLPFPGIGLEIVLDRPNQENMTVYTPSVIFEGIVKDGSSLSINGLNIPINIGGKFEYEVKLNSKNGNNYFLLRHPMDRKRCK